MPSSEFDAHFNSIKVQLRPAGLNKRGLIDAFQFHKGTIKTYLFRNRRTKTFISIP